MSGVVIVDTGVANLRSMETALVRAGRRPERTNDPERVRSAEFVVLPGVGSFARGTAALRGGLGESLRRRIEDGGATLAVCLGMQLLADSSEEDAGAVGLGVLPGRIVRLAAERVPHLGWSPVAPADAAAWPAPGYAAFAHSYALPAASVVDLAADGWSAATCPSAGGFVAAVRRGAVVGCQFHPELSGAWGRDLIDDWLNGTEVGS